MRTTKADLQKQVDALLLEKYHLRKQMEEQLKMKDEIINAYKRPTECLTIALEKTTEAIAHVISDLKSFKGR